MKRKDKTGEKPRFSKYFLKTHPNVNPDRSPRNTDDYVPFREEPAATTARFETYSSPGLLSRERRSRGDTIDILRGEHFLTHAFQNSGGIHSLGRLVDFPRLPTREPVECAVAADRENGKWTFTRFFRRHAGGEWQEQKFDAPAAASVGKIISALAGWSFVAGKRSAARDVSDLHPEAETVTEATYIPRHDR